MTPGKPREGSFSPVSHNASQFIIRSTLIVSPYNTVFYISVCGLNCGEINVVSHNASQLTFILHKGWCTLVEWRDLNLSRLYITIKGPVSLFDEQ